MKFDEMGKVYIKHTLINYNQGREMSQMNYDSSFEPWWFKWTMVWLVYIGNEPYTKFISQNDKINYLYRSVAYYFDSYDNSQYLVFHE